MNLEPAVNAKSQRGRDATKPIRAKDVKDAKPKETAFSFAAFAFFARQRNLCRTRRCWEMALRRRSEAKPQPKQLPLPHRLEDRGEIFPNPVRAMNP